MQPKRPAKLGHFETSRLFFFFKVILYYYFLIIIPFLLTPSSSISFFLVLFLLSFPLYLFFLPYSCFFIFWNFHKWDNKTWNCEKTRVGPKEGASQQLRQWNKFHFATLEKLQVIVISYYYFFHYSYITHFISISVSLFFLFSLLHDWLICIVWLVSPCSLFHSVWLINCLSLHLCSISTIL